MPRRKATTGQQGQAMVETALMIMAVLLLLMGIIEFGFLFFAYVRVSNATREGARAGSLWLVDQVTDDDIAIAVVGQDPVNCASESVTPEAGQPITVTVTYGYELPVVSGLPIMRDIITSPYPVSRAVSMRFQ
jgi:Flp pilus assembly protein TadG